MSLTSSQYYERGNLKNENHKSTRVLLEKGDEKRVDLDNKRVDLDNKRVDLDNKRVDLDNKSDNCNKLIKEIIHSENTTTKSQVNQDETNNEPELYEYMELMTNLKLLSYVKEQDKLAKTENKMEIDNRYYLQGVRRWYNGDSRDLTLHFIEKIVKSADSISEDLAKSKNSDDKYNLKLLTEDLISSKSGLNNLKITYNEDKLFISTIDNLIEKIKIRICKNQLI